MSGDPEQEYFADGMVEEIITALSRIRWLFVIARNSTFTYKGQAIDVKRVGIGPSLSVIGHAYFFSRRFTEAVPNLLLAIQEDLTGTLAYRILAASYAHMGRFEEARETVKRLRAFSSIVVPDASHFRNPEHRELFLSGLRLAIGEPK
jgi:pentatricopeptide repeat protein